MVDRRGDSEFYSSEDIATCMRRVTSLQLHETVIVDGDIEITPYYAGHVLGVSVALLHRTHGVAVTRTLPYRPYAIAGACMYRVKVGGESVVYTGDYTTSPDRHLGIH